MLLLVGTCTLYSVFLRKCLIFFGEFDFSELAPASSFPIWKSLHTMLTIDYNHSTFIPYVYGAVLFFIERLLELFVSSLVYCDSPPASLLSSLSPFLGYPYIIDLILIASVLMLLFSCGASRT